MGNGHTGPAATRSSVRPPLRYGTEYEGCFFGQKTLVLPCADDHRIEFIEEELLKHDCVRPTHLWLETQLGEVFNWGEIAALLEAGFRITLQVRTAEDLPPLLPHNHNVCIVWMVPPEYHEILSRLQFIKVVHGPGPFDGFEIAVQTRHGFPADLYVKEDEIWQRD
jgi:hypothetical protein